MPTLAWYYACSEDKHFKFTKTPPQYSLRLLLKNFQVTGDPIQTKDEAKMPHNQDLVVCFFDYEMIISLILRPSIARNGTP